VIRMLLVGGCLGSVAGVIGASISDPEVGFPAWVDVTGVVAGFGLGVLVTGVVLLVRATWSKRREQHRDAQVRPRTAVIASNDETISGATDRATDGSDGTRTRDLRRDGTATGTQ
jgi:hypothetical protein